MAEQAQALRTLANKIDHLFTLVHPAQGEYTHEQVAAAIAEAGGPTISATYLWQLRKGLRENPTKRHLEALSSFFGVPPSYFFDADTAAHADDESELLAAMCNPQIRRLAAGAMGLAPDTLATLIGMMERARQLE